MLYHVTLATQGRFPLAGARRFGGAAVRCLRDALVLFAFADEHGHFVVEGDRRAVGHRLTGLSRALVHLSGAQLEPARVRDVADRSHLRSLVGYLVSQPRHHGAGSWEATCLPDLVGARRLGLPTRISELLPRDDLPAMALAAAGLNLHRIEPATDAELRALGPARVHAAGLAALGLDPEGLRVPARVAHERVFRHLADQLGFGPAARDLARVGVRTWQRHAHVAPDAAHATALRQWISLEEAIRRGPAADRAR